MTPDNRADTDSAQLGKGYGEISGGPLCDEGEEDDEEAGGEGPDETGEEEHQPEGEEEAPTDGDTHPVDYLEVDIRTGRQRHHCPRVGRSPEERTLDVILEKRRIFCDSKE